MRFIQVLPFGILGLLFGIVLSKGEVISWFRIQEMFRFDAFHMYGVLGSAVLISAAGIALMKRFGAKNVHGEAIAIPAKARSIPRYLFGGIIFGMGWALTGACPGPVYILLGQGFTVFVVVLLSALFGTYMYGVLRERLPH